MDMSNREFIALVGLEAGGGDFVVGAGEGAAEKSPKSLPKSLAKELAVGCEGGDIGFGGGVGLMSKKLPPLKALGF